MIKCDMKYGTGNVEIQGELDEILADITTLTLRCIKMQSKNEVAFEGLKSIFIEVFKCASYEEVQEG